MKYRGERRVDCSARTRVTLVETHEGRVCAGVCEGGGHTAHRERRKILDARDAVAGQVEHGQRAIPLHYLRHQILRQLVDGHRAPPTRQGLEEVRV